MSTCESWAPPRNKTLGRSPIGSVCRDSLSGDTMGPDTADFLSAKSWWRRTTRQPWVNAAASSILGPSISFVIVSHKFESDIVVFGARLIVARRITPPWRDTLDESSARSMSLTRILQENQRKMNCPSAWWFRTILGPACRMFGHREPSSGLTTFEALGIPLRIETLRPLKH